MPKAADFKVSKHWPFPKLRPYEIQNIAFEKGRERDLDMPAWGNYLEQGMGKTLLEYADFYDMVYRDKVECQAIIAPTYLKSNWESENEEYGLPWPVFTWPNVPTEKEEKTPFTFVINTEAVLYSGGKYLDALMKRRRTLLGIDESVCISNFKSQIAKAVLVNFMHLAVARRALSGLPAGENVMQWWPQLRFCGELNGVNPYVFRNRYAVMGGYMGKKVTGTKNQEELDEIKNRCMIRALKRDWLDLPEKIPNPPAMFEMGGKQMAAYRSMLADFYTEVDNGEVMANMVIHQLMKLQQISRGFIKDGETIHELVPPKDNPAIKTLKSIRDQVRGKAIIFTYHEYSTKTLFGQWQEDGRECVVLRGGLTTAEIKERKDAFNRDPKVRDLIGQLSVAAKGHTLLGQPGIDRCSTSLYYEVMYSKEIHDQSEDRNHRHGQDEPVNYMYICEDAPGSPTRKALRALSKKQDFVEATVNNIRLRRKT